jgi:hypothetical protein
MSRLTKLARIYKAVTYLEKRAFSLAGVQKAVGATGGNIAKSEAKSFARASLNNAGKEAKQALDASQAKINELRSSLKSMHPKDRALAKVEVDKQIAAIRQDMAVHEKTVQDQFKKSYSIQKGKGAVSEGQALNRAAINSDEQLLALRKEQKVLSKKLQDASPEQAKQIQNEIKSLQQKQKLRTDEVIGSVNKGDQAVIERATAKQQAATTTTAKDVQRTAINTDPQMMKLREEYKALKANKPANGQIDPSRQKQFDDLKAKMNERATEVSKEFNSSPELRAKAEYTLGGKNIGGTYKAKGATPAQYNNGNKLTGGSLVEQQAIQEGALQKQYNSLLKDKNVLSQAEAITGGTADPKMMQAFKSFQKNNPYGTAQEFVAQSQLQSQVRNSIGGGRQAGGMFGSEVGGKQVQNLAQDLQYGKGQYAFGQEMQNAQNAMNKQYSQYASNANKAGQQVMNQEQFALQQAQQQQQFAQQQLLQQNQQAIQQNAQQLLQGGQAANMDAALTQARANFKAPTQSPLQNIPLTPDQQIAFKYTGNVQGAVDPRFSSINQNPITTTPLQATQSSAIQTQAQTLKGPELKQFNQATQTAPLNQNQVRQNTINTQNQATAQQRDMSVAGKQNQQASNNNMFGGYGMPIAAGAGLLGAGYLYANSGNSQQPTPYQGGS